jgi:hypothetical protein
VIDLETGIVRDINTVNNFCGAWDNFVNVKSLALLAPGFDRGVNYKGEVVSFNTTMFRWDGLGKVFLVSSPGANPYKNLIWADDELIVGGIVGCGSPEYGFGSGGVWQFPALEITGIIHKGYNIVQAQIRDVYATRIGCSPLYVVQVGDSGNLGFHGIIADKICGLGNDFINGARHLNMEKVLAVGLGTISVVGGFVIVAGAVAAAPETGGISLGAMFWGWTGMVGGATALAYSADDPWFYEQNNF